MKTMIYPHQYNYIRSVILRLKNVYKTVNDKETVKVIQSETYNDINEIFGHIDDDIEESLKVLMNIRLSNKEIEAILNKFLEYVVPFELPSPQKLQKVFKKVKKIKIPQFEEYDLKVSSFVGWNELASNRKYIIYYDEKKQLKGLYGEISNQVVKGFCTICNKESNVSLFMKKSKTNSDGQYVKKGDYICRDSIHCNKQLTDINQFYNFMYKLD